MHRIQSNPWMDPTHVQLFPFLCQRLERSASPRRICAVTRGFQTTTQDRFFIVPTKTLSYDSCVTITIHHYCLDTCGPCNN